MVSQSTDTKVFIWFFSLLPWLGTKAKQNEKLRSPPCQSKLRIPSLFSHFSLLLFYQKHFNETDDCRQFKGSNFDVLNVVLCRPTKDVVVLFSNCENEFFWQQFLNDWKTVFKGAFLPKMFPLLISWSLQG